ncbi:hypothetical protein ACFL67_02670 [candidate division KSB1 bacterium]
MIDRTVVTASAGYGFADGVFKKSASFIKFLDKKNRFFTEFSYSDEMGTEQKNRKVSDGKNTVSSFLFRDDYRDYRYVKKKSIGFGYNYDQKLTFKVSGFSRDESNAANNTEFGIFRGKNGFRVNPAIAEGTFEGIATVLRYADINSTLFVSTESARGGAFQEEFSYNRLYGDIQFLIRPTNFSKLRISLIGGYSDGVTPPQRWFDFGGKSFLNYYGNLRGVDYRYFAGDKMILGVVDYTFSRSSLFDITNSLPAWEKIGAWLKVTPWIGFGWSEVSAENREIAVNLNIPCMTTGGLYSEFGIGIGDRFNFLRLDVLHSNLSGGAVKFNVNLLK